MAALEVQFCESQISAKILCAHVMQKKINILKLLNSAEIYRSRKTPDAVLSLGHPRSRRLLLIYRFFLAVDDTTNKSVKCMSVVSLSRVHHVTR